MFGNTYIKKAADSETLNQFVHKTFKQLRLQPEERETSNQAGGSYFVASALGIQVKIAEADDSEFQNFDFWISFRSTIGWDLGREAMEGIADCVARELALAGYHVVRTRTDPTGPNGVRRKFTFTRKTGTKEVEVQETS